MAPLAPVPMGPLRSVGVAPLTPVYSVVDNEKVASESKAYQKIPEILSFVNERGEDKMKQEIDSNYRQIKKDITNIVESELERIKNDPDLKHLL